MAWEHDSIEKYVVLMGRLINDIQVDVYNEELKVNETLKVPVTYGPREKVIAAANRPSIDDEDAGRVAVTLPRITFECGSTTYDNSRATPATKKIKLDDGAWLYNPAPWNFGFTVSIVAKSARVANRIMEQIVPRFSPALSMTVKPVKGYDHYTKDVIIELQSVNPSNNYEGDFNERQFIGWDLQFNLKGWLFGPVTKAGTITQVEVGLDELEGIEIKPGLTSGGEPTDNDQLTIARNLIKSTDNYDYITAYRSEGE